MVKVGTSAIPALLSNLGNYERQAPIFELLGELRAEDAVPKLLDELEMRDCERDWLIIAKLAEITQIKEAFHPILTGIHHSRIEYPGEIVSDEKSRENDGKNKRLYC